MSGSTAGGPRADWWRTIVGELLGLFVDDGRFAIAILAWLAVCWFAVPRLHWSAGAQGLLLFAGLAAILVESTWRRGRRR